jgi:hypothetical protein
MDIFAKTKQKLVIALVASVLALAASIGFYFMVSAKLTAVTQLREDVSRAKTEDIVTLKRAIRAFEDRSALLDDLLISETSLFSFVGDIERLAKQTGALASVENIAVIDVGNDGAEYALDTITEEQRSHGVLTLTVRLQGSWEELVSFLLQAEQLPYQTTIDAVRFASLYDAKTGVQTWTALFELVTVIE